MSNTIYLLVSPDEFIIEKKTNEILSKIKKEDTEIIKYDLLETPIERVVEDLDTYNFLCSKKIVIATNAYFLSGDKPRLAIEHNLTKYEKYLNNPSPDNVLIISCEKLDNRKKIVDLTKKNSKVIDMNINLVALIKSNLEDFSISSKDIDFLIEYLAGDSARCISELEKLKLYKFDEKEITRDDIINIVTKTVDDNVFTLADSIIKKDKKKAIEIYQEMVLHNQKASDIIPLVASKFRLMYQVKILDKTMYSSDDIAKTLGVKKYPVELTRDIARKYKDEEILKFLNMLAELDYNIKTNKMYEGVAFEQFIFSL